MDLGLIATFVGMIVVMIIVAIDQSINEEKTYILGSEWDFTKTDFNPKSLDKTK